MKYQIKLSLLVVSMLGMKGVENPHGRVCHNNDAFSYYPILTRTQRSSTLTHENMAEHENLNNVTYEIYK